MKKLTKADFERLASEALAEFRGLEPRDSNNMADTATKLDFIGDFEAKIYIDQEIAPYWKYTEFTWAETSPVIVNAPSNPALLGRSSFLWNKGDTPGGTPKRNPNQGWTKRAMIAVAAFITYRLGGNFKLR